MICFFFIYFIFIFFTNKFSPYNILVMGCASSTSTTDSSKLTKRDSKNRIDPVAISIFRGGSANQIDDRPLFNVLHQPVDMNPTSPPRLSGSEIESTLSTSTGSMSFSQSSRSMRDLKMDSCYETIEHSQVENDTLVKVNQYTVLHQLGKGSYATVRLCFHSVSNELFAIKIPRRPRKHVFRQEINILQRCGFHPNIVMLHGVLHREETFETYLVMEYMPGGSMGSMESFPLKVNPIDIGEVPRIRQQYYDVLQGLAHLHRQNIVHRDIKPENILIGEGGVCKLSDFGLSKFLSSSDERLQKMSGSKYFLPPEAWLERNHSGYASDMWALGVTMYTSVFQCLPYANPGDMLSQTGTHLTLPPCETLQKGAPMLLDVMHHLLCRSESGRLNVEDALRHPFFTESVSTTK
eukprot:PhF_6_TR6177/c0_g1_i7/m.9256/K07359/CAMKK2; calcium/calmodulin-dependent protein kinase kinase 2